MFLGPLNRGDGMRILFGGWRGRRELGDGSPRSSRSSHFVKALLYFPFFFALALLFSCSGNRDIVDRQWACEAFSFRG